ncbi:MAG: hypothetical protein ACFB21_07555 [Opitutales bacterium]
MPSFASPKYGLALPGWAPRWILAGLIAVALASAHGAFFRAEHAGWKIAVPAPTDWSAPQSKEGGLILQLHEPANNRGVQVYAYPRLTRLDDAASVLQRFLGDLERRFAVEGFGDMTTGTLQGRPAAYSRGRLTLTDDAGLEITTEALIATYQARDTFFTVWTTVRQPAPEQELRDMISLIRNVRIERAELEDAPSTGRGSEE